MKNYKKYFLLHATPEAVMAAEPGTEFSLWSGDISGRNIAFEPNAKIVQEWYFGEQEEPSIVTIKLHPHEKGTSVELFHTNIPDEEFDDFAEGWEDSYFGTLREFFRE